MKRTLLVLLLFMNGLVVFAQAPAGSIKLCVRMALTNECFEDTVTVLVEGITKRSLKVKPDSSGSILLQKLTYGNYTIKVSAKDCMEEKINGIIVKGTKPVFLDLCLKSSIIQLTMELTAYATRPMPITAQKPSTAEEIKAREIAEAQYVVYAQKQKEEFKQLKNGSWKMTDSLRNNLVTDLKSWHELMRKSVLYPQDAKDLGMGGKIYLGFETDEKGYIQNITLLHGYDPELVVELAHTLHKAPGIFPPENEARKPVRQKYVLSVRFTLEWGFTKQNRFTNSNTRPYNSRYAFCFL
jgi:TonB-like protein